MFSCVHQRTYDSDFVLQFSKSKACVVQPRTVMNLALRQSKGEEEEEKEEVVVEEVVVEVVVVEEEEEEELLTWGKSPLDLLGLFLSMQSTGWGFIV